MYLSYAELKYNTLVNQAEEFGYLELTKFINFNFKNTKLLKL